MDGNNTRHTNCTLPCMPFVSRKEKVREYVPLCHCSIYLDRKAYGRNNTSHTDCTLAFMPFVSRKEKVREPVPISHCFIS